MADKKQRRSMISVRGGYSDKHNMGSVTNAIQIKEFDDRTRTILSNKTRGLLEGLFEKDLGHQYFMDTHSLPHEFCTNILSRTVQKFPPRRRLTLRRKLPLLRPPP